MCANKECNTCLPSDHGPEANVAHGQRMKSKMTVGEGERGRGGWGREGGRLTERLIHRILEPRERRVVPKLA